MQFLCFIGSEIDLVFFYFASLLIWMFQHGCLDTCVVLGVLYACVVYSSICTCSGQLSMFHME